MHWSLLRTVFLCLSIFAASARLSPQTAPASTEHPPMPRSRANLYSSERTDLRQCLFIVACHAGSWLHVRTGSWSPVDGVAAE